MSASVLRAAVEGSLSAHAIAQTYTAGYVAGSSAAPIAANPHASGSEEGKLWAAGFESARRDRRSFVVEKMRRERGDW